MGDGMQIANLIRRYDVACRLGDVNVAREVALQLRRLGIDIVPARTDGGADTYETAVAPVAKRGPGRPRKNTQGA